MQQEMQVAQGLGRKVWKSKSGNCPKSLVSCTNKEPVQDSVLCMEVYTYTAACIALVS